MSKSAKAPNWQKDFDLSGLNTLAAPSQAEFYVEVATDEQLVEAVKCAKERGLALHILGGGSNVLCAPKILGLVIRPMYAGVTHQGVCYREFEVGLDSTRGDGTVIVTVGAGEIWHELVVSTLEQSLFGLENLALIPGSVGAAPIQNIGAYGVELADVLVSVRWFDCDKQAFLEYSAEQCELEYRGSVFKNQLKERAIITHVSLRLQTSEKPLVSYGPLAQYFADKQPTARAVFERVCELRESKLPSPSTVPNAGSFFKNPVVTREVFERVQREHPSVPFYPTGKGCVKIPAAWLIDCAGLKGETIGRLKVHVHQALVLTNPDRCDFAHIQRAGELITAQVKAKFGICLEVEPQPL